MNQGRNTFSFCCLKFEYDVKTDYRNLTRNSKRFENSTFQLNCFFSNDKLAEFECMGPELSILSCPGPQVRPKAKLTLKISVHELRILEYIYHL